MAKHPPAEDSLDKASRKRLEKFGAQWSEPGEGWISDKLTLPDLKLLLEHFTPLQDLIRTLMAKPAGASPGVLAHETASLRDQASAAQAAKEHAEAALASTQAELTQANERRRAVEHDLKQCTAKVKELQEENRIQKQTMQQLEQQCQQLQNTLSAAQAKLARSGSAPAELALLRQDTALAQALGLEPLPSDDTQALIQTVAVLSQRDNLERLWGALKDRCEANNRAATAGEHALLQAALAWHNHNWRTRPYRLIEATPASTYHFEYHQRSRHTNSGETISAQHLPGIADGSGRQLCKVLVSTR
jgi:myosin heavy subunit